MHSLPNHVGSFALAALLLALTSTCLASAEPAPEWQNPAVQHAGVEAPFATMTVFADAASAQALDRTRSLLLSH
jgi:hypothetical protein